METMNLAVGETYLFKKVPIEEYEIKNPSHWQMQLKEYTVVKLTDKSIKVAQPEDKESWDFTWYTLEDFNNLFILIEKL